MRSNGEKRFTIRPSAALSDEPKAPHVIVIRRRDVSAFNEAVLEYQPSRTTHGFRCKRRSHSIKGVFGRDEKFSREVGKEILRPIPIQPARFNETLVMRTWCNVHNRMQRGRRVGPLLWGTLFSCRFSLPFCPFFSLDYIIRIVIVIRPRQKGDAARQCHENLTARGRMKSNGTDFITSAESRVF